jgi:outer membrane protein assembly factor BamB
MTAGPETIFVGIKGEVLALDRSSGTTQWRCELKGSDFVNVTLQGGDLFAASKGRLYRLDPGSGAILWCNELPGLGWGVMTIAGGSQVASAEEKRRRDAQAAAAAS